MLSRAIAILAAIGQVATPPIVISVHDARPLAAAVQTLEREYGWIVTYEDPRYEYRESVENVAATVRRDGDVSKPVLVLKGGPFYFRHELNGDGPPSPLEVLSALVSEYNATGYPGRFAVRHANGIFHVVPIQTENEQGILTEQSSQLDVRVSLPAQRRNVDQMLTDVFREVTRVTGVRIFHGGIASNLFLQTMVEEGVRAEPAREVIIRTVATTGRQWSWALFQRPGSKEYGFNLHLVD